MSKKALYAPWDAFASFKPPISLIMASTQPKQIENVLFVTPVDWVKFDMGSSHIEGLSKAPQYKADLRKISWQPTPHMTQSWVLLVLQMLSGVKS